MQYFPQIFGSGSVLGSNPNRPGGVGEKQGMYRVSSQYGKFYQLFSFVHNIDLLSPSSSESDSSPVSSMTNSEFSYQNSKTKVSRVVVAHNPSTRESHAFSPSTIEEYKAG